MSIDNQYELQKQRLQDMAEQVTKMQLELDINYEKDKQVRQCVEEFELLRTEWKNLICDLKEKNAEYTILINELRILRKKMIQIL